MRRALHVGNSLRAAAALAALTLLHCNTEALGPMAPDLALPPPPDLALRPDLAVPPDLAPPTFMPAPHPPLPQIPNLGGRTMDRLSLVAITWQGDPLEKDLAQFNTWLPGSDYFTKHLAEYGYKGGSLEATYAIPQPAPAVLEEKDLQATLRMLVENGRVPGVTRERLYAVYLPEGTALRTTFGGMITYQTCKELYAFHNTGPTVQSGAIIYVLVPRCRVDGFTDLDFVTWLASGALAQAVTYPTYMGWRGNIPDPQSPYGVDVTSLCQTFLHNDGGFTLSGLYSNVAAKGDMRPCLPAPAGPMFGAPPDHDELTIQAGAGDAVKVRIWSSSPLPRPLRLTANAYPVNAFSARAAKSQVLNGEEVRIDVNASKSAQPGARGIVILRLDAPDYHWENYVQLTAE